MGGARPVQSPRCKRAAMALFEWASSEQTDGEVSQPAAFGIRLIADQGSAGAEGEN